MPKPRKCRCGCGELIPAGNTLRKAATVECALRIGRADREKRERKELRADRLRIKTRQQWLKEVQVAFNAFIRERDHANPCISCQRFHAGKYDAGHFRTVKASPELRFDEDNVHKQCSPCNTQLSGDISRFRIGLIEKIGADRLAYLEGPHPPKKYTIPELIELKKEFTRRRRELEKERL